MVDDVIHFDAKSGRVTGATLSERVAVNLFRLGGLISSAWGHIGYSIGAKMVRGVLPSKRNIQMRLMDDTLFEYPYGDGYWSRMLNTRRTYSPELDNLLHRMCDIDYTFIDCGANYGYFSVLVSSRKYGEKQAIAVEADGNNYAMLTRNAFINGNRFGCRHNAVYSKSGEELMLYGEKHEAFSLVDAGGASKRGKVTTVTIDDLLREVDREGKKPVVLKLDIEGVEVESMGGATQTLKRDVLVVFEEHGEDKQHTVARHMKEALGLRFFYDRKMNNLLEEITSLDEIAALKTNSRIGYDIVATRSPFWIDQIERMNERVRGKMAG